MPANVTVPCSAQSAELHDGDVTASSTKAVAHSPTVLPRTAVGSMCVASGGAQLSGSSIPRLSRKARPTSSSSRRTESGSDIVKVVTVRGDSPPASHPSGARRIELPVMAR
ncbi:MAG: hypothetical protein ABT00_12635 [Bordetella sp. SCN 68-11]|nr:MAG: hypothetical protein ABT00_12635 [Bordetella sp. SCN 68-11]